MQSSSAQGFCWHANTGEKTWGNCIVSERIAVLPEFRGRGVAVALMTAFENAVQALGIPEARVGVRASLPANLRFYENLGYRALASQSYPTGTDVELTLSKGLAAKPR